LATKYLSTQPILRNGLCAFYLLRNCSGL
jgi:hypothetical protein